MTEGRSSARLRRGDQDACYKSHVSDLDARASTQSHSRGVSSIGGAVTGPLRMRPQPEIPRSLTAQAGKGRGHAHSGGDSPHGPRRESKPRPVSLRSWPG